MPQTNQNSSIQSTADIRIVSINRDKTRKTNESNTEYQVYLELSESPTRAWRNIFEQEWKNLNPTVSQYAGWQETVIDRGFLVIHCALEGVAAHLPVLKRAVEATNKSYQLYVIEQATEQEHIGDVWKQERKAVASMAETLHFE